MISRKAHAEYLAKIRLMKEIFKIMSADVISETAKSDPLIAFYGEAYLSRHIRKQIATKVSNEMREFARFLIALRETTGVESMFDAIKPEFYPMVVDAVKQISGYDSDKLAFKASLFSHAHENEPGAFVCNSRKTCTFEIQPFQMLQPCRNTT